MGKRHIKIQRLCKYIPWLYPKKVKTNGEKHKFNRCTWLELRKKYLFVKKLDNDVLCYERTASTIAIWSEISAADLMYNDRI